MQRRVIVIILFGVSLAASLAGADEAIYRYEGDVLPHDPSPGWEIFNPCDTVQRVICTVT